MFQANRSGREAAAEQLAALLPDEELGRTKVIVAEDQPAMRGLIASRLREAGYDVVEVSDGEVLWRELRESARDEDNPREADLIISDIRMPGRSGLDVLSLIRRTDWKTPVILMTAFGTPEVVSGALQLGAYRVVPKPFELGELAALVRQAHGARSA